MPTPKQRRPILLFDDECGVCRRIARWVRASARIEAGKPSIVPRPIGNDPDELRALDPGLDIWQAYATIHVLMPDGTMKLGGEAVAEVLRSVRHTRWFTWSFAVGIFGFRPFQLILDLAYAILADVRPLFGCESCGTPSRWVRSIRWLIERTRTLFGKARQPRPTPHFTSQLMTKDAAVQSPRAS